MGLTKEEQREQIRINKKELTKKVKKQKQVYKPNNGYKFNVNEILVKGIYFLYQNNVIVYIGQSKSNVMDRICTHYSDPKKIFNSFRFHEKNKLSSIQLNELEKKLIKRYRPKYNIINNKRKRPIIIYGNNR